MLEKLFDGHNTFFNCGLFAVVVGAGLLLHTSNIPWITKREKNRRAYFARKSQKKALQNKEEEELTFYRVNRFISLVGCGIAALGAILIFVSLAI